MQSMVIGKPYALETITTSRNLSAKRRWSMIRSDAEFQEVQRVEPITHVRAAGG
jgi:hypothetical protein